MSAFDVHLNTYATMKYKRHDIYYCSVLNTMLKYISIYSNLKAHKLSFNQYCLMNV